MKRTLSRLRRGAAGVALSALAVTGLSVAPAQAADQDQVAAEGRFLDLDDLLLGLDLNPLANLNGHYNGIPSSEGSGGAPVDLDVLGALNLQVGLTALPLQDLITLGVAEQYSKASNDGSLLASSGLVANDGAIATGTGAPGENAVIDLSKLLGTGDTGSADPTGLVEQLRLELGAVSGLAKYNKTDGLDSDYQVAGAKLKLKSKVVGQLVSNLTAGLTEVEKAVREELAPTLSALLTPVGALVSPLTPLIATSLLADGGIVGVADTDLIVNLHVIDKVSALLTSKLTSDDGALEIDLGTGEITVDLARVVKAHTGGGTASDLNGLPANYEVLDDPTIAAIVDGLESLLDKLAGNVVKAANDALKETSLTIRLTQAVTHSTLLPLTKQVRGTLQTDINIGLGGQQPTIDFSGSSLKDKNGNDYTVEPGLIGSLVNLITGTLLNGVVSPLLTAVTDIATSGLVKTIIEPITDAAKPLLSSVFDVLTVLLSVKVNAQDDPGKFVDTRGPDDDSFTVHAVRVQLLPGADPLLNLALAGATVTTEPLVTTALAASPATPAAGDKVTLTATGYANGETVTFKQGTTTIGTATAGSDGTATLDTFRVPASANAGDKIDFTSTGTTNTTPAEASVTVKAGPSIAVTPGQGPAGTEAAITGSGFTPAPAGTTIDVPITVGGQPAGTVKVDDTGKIVDGQSITIPAGLTGPVKVVADDANRVDPSADFTVTAATLVTDVTQVHAGEDVKLTATGFAPGEKVSFTVAGNATPLGEGTADASGNVTTAVSYTVPNGTASGTILTFTATGVDSGASDDGNVTVLAGPTLNLGPAQGPAGSEVTLTGGGYTPNAEVTIKMPGAPDKKVTTTGTGELPAGTVVTIPAGQASPLTITVDDPKRDDASAPFTVTVPALTATPGTVQAGRSVTLSASGFQPGETVTFTISGAPIGGPVVADASGNATATESYKVPSGTAPGQFGPFTATGGTSDAVASTQVTVTAGPALQPNPPMGPVGSVVTLTGTGFTPNADVTVTVQGSSPAKTITVHTTATGEFPAGTTIKVSDVQGPATGFTAVDPELDQVFVPFLLTQQDIAASKPQLAPGQQTQLSLSGFQPGESVEISDGTNVIATVPAAAPGAPLWLPTTYTVADDAAPGTVTFTAKGLVSGATDTTVVTILSGPTLVLTPNQGPEGSVVTLSGSGYSPDTEVTIKVPGAPDKKVTTTPSGDLPGNVQITVPDGAAGQLAVTVEDPDRADGKATFTVTTPEITADKTQAKAGDTVQLSASGFQPGELVTFSIGGTQVGTPVTADASGSATATATYTVPAKTAAGTVLTFTAEGGTSGASDTVDVTVLAGPTLNLTPSTGPSGSTVVVTGGGYEPGSEITIKVPGGTDVVVTATPLGEIPAGTTVTIPGGQDDGAELGITANDGKHDDGSATFTVTSPTFTASTTTPTVGDQVTFTGSGFVPGETVTVVFPDGSSPTDAPTADANGGFTVTWTPTQAGSGQATAEGAASQTPLSVELTVSDRPVQDELTLTPSNATPAKDEVVTFTGTGATPNATVTLTGPSGTPATVQANDEGEFSFTWTAGDPGVQTFTAKDGDREATATVTVQDDPGTGSNPGANDISNKDKNASASAGASVQADGNRNAGSVAAAQAAAFADASSNTNASAAASAAADGDRNAGSVAAAQAAAVADVDDAASADASKDATSHANASSAAAAQAAATHQGDNDTNAAASVQGDNKGTANAAAAAQAAAIANSSTNASQNASADSNASASANASANADGNRNAGSVAAAQAAAYKDADSNSAKDAAATANATSAAAAAATANASKDASTDSTSTSTSAAQAAATSTSDEKSTSDANATAAANANASKAAAASSTTVANGSQNASQNASADSNASASASASANADGNQNAVAQAAAQAAAYSNSDQESDASAAASKDATAASQAAANEQASSEASADVTSAANAQAIAAAQSASEANASTSATSTANANAAAAAAANATGSKDASVDAASNADGNNESEASKDADGGKDGVNATANDNANAEAEAESNSSADASSEAESNATADANATAEADSNATADANADGSADGVTNEPKSTVSFKSIVRGTGVVQVVTGTDFQPGETVNATVHSKPIKLKAAKADANGKVTFRFAVGATFELGDHSVKLVGAKSGAVKPENDTTAFKVLDGINVGGVGQERPVSSDANSTSAANGNGSANGGQGLVDTGASSSLLWLAGVALLLLAAGGVTLAIRQRRKA